MSTAGEGGMVTTNSQEYWQRIWSYKDHGKSWQAVYEKAHPPGFRWLHESFGTNWRMTEIQAAVGLRQLQKMPQWRETRQAYSQQIWQTSAGLSGLRVPQLPEYIEHAGYKCYVFVRPEKLRADWSRDRIMAEINGLNVPCFSGSCSEVYREKAFEDTGLVPEHSLPNAAELGETSLMFLVHPTLTQAEIDATCAAIEDVMGRASI